MRKAGSAGLVATSVCAVALLATVAVVIKLIHAGPWTIAVVRLFVGAVGIGLYGWWRDELRRLGRGEVLALARMGLLFGVHWISYFYSIKLSSPSLAMLALSAYGPSAILWSRLLLKEPIHGDDALAMALALAGTVLCIPSHSPGGAVVAGFLLGIVSGMLYGLLPIMQKRTAAYPVSQKAFGQFGFALLAFVPFLGYCNWDLSERDWAGLLFLGIVGTFIAHTLWVKVTTQLPPTIASVLFYAQIPGAMLLSVLVLGEVLPWRLLVGALLIICGNVLSIVFRVRRQSVVAVEDIQASEVRERELHESA